MRNPGNFFVVALALIFLALAVAEDATYRSWYTALARQTENQEKIAAARHQNILLEQLLRRIAYDSMNDPGIIDSLKPFGITLRMSTPDSGKAFTSGAAFSETTISAGTRPSSAPTTIPSNR